MANYTISIPKPCSQSWDEMDVQSNGRYCLACNKVVVDFTSMSEKEVLDFLLKNKSTCGRVSSRILGKSIKRQIPLKARKIYWSPVAAMLVAGMFSISNSYSQKLYPRSIATEKVPADPTSEEYLDEELDTIAIDKHPRTIKGFVFEKESKLPAYASVYVELSDKKIYGDNVNYNDGSFKFKLPTDCIDKKITIKVRGVGYEDYETVVWLNDIKYELELRIELEDSAVELMGFIIPKKDPDFKDSKKRKDKNK